MRTKLAEITGKRWGLIEYVSPEHGSEYDIVDWSNSDGLLYELRDRRDLKAQVCETPLDHIEAAQIYENACSQEASKSGDFLSYSIKVDDKEIAIITTSVNWR